MNNNESSGNIDPEASSVSVNDEAEVPILEDLDISTKDHLDYHPVYEVATTASSEYIGSISYKEVR